MTTGCLERALVWFAEHGTRAVQARRKENSASIKETAEHFEASTATVKRYCTA
ncbi:hypothetical protein [Solimonas variicoloris]|uniref:hypothetical protein n=1 Tax=Solimonas variicoloris TaxID=254408 RepID=UPI000367E3D8|nr:hypothetical protein [Solimonas variicoloris]